MPPTGWLKQQKCISRSSGGWKFKVKVVTGLIFLEASLLTYHLCSHMAFPLCVNAPCSKEN